MAQSSQTESFVNNAFDWLMRCDATRCSRAAPALHASDPECFWIDMGLSGTIKKRESFVPETTKNDLEQQRPTQTFKKHNHHIPQFHLGGDINWTKDGVVFLGYLPGCFNPTHYTAAAAYLLDCRTWQHLAWTLGTDVGPRRHQTPKQTSPDAS